MTCPALHSCRSWKPGGRTPKGNGDSICIPCCTSMVAGSQGAERRKAMETLWAATCSGVQLMEARGQNAERQWRPDLDGPTGGVASPLPRQAQAGQRLMNCWWQLEGQEGGTVRGWCLLGPQAAQPQALKRTTWEPCGNEECRMKNAE